MFWRKKAAGFWEGPQKLSESLPYFIAKTGCKNLWGMCAKIHKVENLLKFSVQIAKKLWRVYNGLIVYGNEGRQ